QVCAPCSAFRGFDENEVARPIHAWNAEGDDAIHSKARGHVVDFFVWVQTLHRYEAAVWRAHMMRKRYELAEICKRAGYDIVKRYSWPEGLDARLLHVR